MNLERNLGGIERQFYEQDRFGSVHGCMVLFFNGFVQWESLDQVLTQLAQDCPPILCSIKAKPVPHIHDYGSLKKISYQIKKRIDQDTWRRIAENTSALKFGETEPCLRVFVVQGLDESELILNFDHRLIDSITGTQICRRLLLRLSGSHDQTTPMELCPPLEALFPVSRRGWRGFLATSFDVAKILYRSRKSFLRLPLLEKSFSRSTFTYGLTITSSTREVLETDAKSHGANLVALLNAIIVHATHRCFGKKTSYICLNLPVSIRPYLDPPVADHNFGLYLAGLLSVADIDDQTSIMDTAVKMRKSISADIKRRFPLGMAKLFKAGSKPLQLRADSNLTRPTLNVSHIRGVEPFPRIGEATISHYRVIGSLWPTDSLMVVCASYGDSIYLDVHASRERLGEFQAMRFCEMLSKIFTEKNWNQRK